MARNKKTLFCYLQSPKFRCSWARGGTFHQPCQGAGEEDNKNPGTEAISGEDLLQEGSIGLLLALDRMEKMDSLAAYRTFLFNEINSYLQKVLEEHKNYEDAGAAALKKVERLDEAMQSLMEDLGRKVTMEEVSAFLEIPVSEIRDIARLAGDELEFADSAGDARMPWEI